MPSQASARRHISPGEQDASAPRDGRGVQQREPARSVRRDHRHDLVDHDSADPEDERDAERFKGCVRVYRTIFSDRRLTTEDQVTEEDKVETRQIYTDTKTEIPWSSPYYCPDGERGNQDQ